MSNQNCEGPKPNGRMTLTILIFNKLKSTLISEKTLFLSQKESIIRSLPCSNEWVNSRTTINNRSQSKSKKFQRGSRSRLKRKSIKFPQEWKKYRHQKGDLIRSRWKNKRRRKTNQKISCVQLLRWWKSLISQGSNLSKWMLKNASLKLITKSIKSSTEMVA